MIAGLLVLGLVVGLVLRIHLFGSRSPPLEPSQAIVVLGARTLPGGAPSPALLGRVEHAVALHQRGMAPLLVLCGGGGPVSEAQAALQIAIARGVPPDACLLEDQSRSTFENARFSRALLRARGVGEVLLVTDDFHAYRAVAHFRRTGLTVRPAPVRRALSKASRLRWTVRELAAVLRRPWLLH